MIKTVLIILLIMTAAALGNERARALKIRADGLRLTGLMISETEALIEYRSATVYEILSCLRKDSRFETLGFIAAADEICRDRNIPFGEAWEKAVRKNIPAYFTARDMELLYSIGKELGKSGVEGQLNALKHKKHETDRICAEAESCYASKGRLYRSLGVLCGAFLAIFLI